MVVDMGTKVKRHPTLQLDAVCYIGLVRFCAMGVLCGVRSIWKRKEESLFYIVKTHPGKDAEVGCF